MKLVKEDEIEMKVVCENVYGQYEYVLDISETRESLSKYNIKFISTDYIEMKECILWRCTFFF
jgi:predicted adenine nucleotide alpha hydrolase (AANH) superfamily ATPase